MIPFHYDPGLYDWATVVSDMSSGQDLDEQIPLLGSSSRQNSHEDRDNALQDDKAALAGALGEANPTYDLADADPPPFKLKNWLFGNKGAVDQIDPSSIATRRSVYDDPLLAKHYWPNDDYENLHRFDTRARWTVQEERDLVRKIDWKVMLWAAISFSALNLDRGNLSQANADGFLTDLGMTTDDYNLGNTIFRLAFLFAELPSQLISKRLGPDRWIPMQMCMWSIVTSAQFWLTGRTSFLVGRGLLGLIQGGFIPDLILYLSYFYTKNELPFRMALFWISSNVCTSDFDQAISSIFSAQNQTDVIPKLHRSLVIPFLDKWHSNYNTRLFRPNTSNTSDLRLRNTCRPSPEPTPNSTSLTIRIPSRPGSPDSSSHPPSPTLDTASLERLLRIILGREYTQLSSDTTGTFFQQATPDGDFVNWQLLDAFASLHDLIKSRARLGKLWPLQEIWEDKSEEPLRRIKILLEPIIQNAMRKLALQEAGPGVGGDAMDGGFAYPAGGRESMVQHLAGVLRGQRLDF